MAGLNQTSALAPAPVAVAESEVDRAEAVRPVRPWPVWVDVTFSEDGATRTRSIAGFARAWTREHVLVQVVMQVTYFLGAREFWTEASRVNRRVIEPAWLGR